MSSFEGGVTGFSFPCMQKKQTFVFVRRREKRPKWKTHEDVQTKPHNRSRLSFLTRPLLFFWSARVFLRKEKKITAA